MTKVYLLDAGALLTNWTDRNPDQSLMTTLSVLNELQNRPSQQRAENLQSTGRLQVKAPDISSVRKITSMAKRSGDDTVLSEADRDIIALALMEHESGQLVVLVSTDLAVLNVASHLSLSVHDPTGRMKHVITWINKCPACGHVETMDIVDNECPVCGTQMKRVRQKSRRK